MQPCWGAAEKVRGHRVVAAHADVAPPPCRLACSKDDTVILNGGGAKADIAERCDMIRQAMEQSTSDYDREKLQERLAKLSGGVAVLKVGAGSLGSPSLVLPLPKSSQLWGMLAGRGRPRAATCCA